MKSKWLRMQKEYYNNTVKNIHKFSNNNPESLILFVAWRVNAVEMVSYCFMFHVSCRVDDKNRPSEMFLCCMYGRPKFTC
jgi:hypothetical protein